MKVIQAVKSGTDRVNVPEFTGRYRIEHVAEARNRR
jgi:hypothetical protein